MSAWAVKEKTSTWDSVFDRAWAGEPQFVSRDGSRTVVVISLRTFNVPEKKEERVLPRIGAMRGKWKLPSDELDRAMDDEIASAFDDGVVSV